MIAMHIEIERTSASHRYSLNSVEIMTIMIICLVFSSFVKRKAAVRSESYSKNKETWFL